MDDLPELVDSSAQTASSSEQRQRPIMMSNGDVHANGSSGGHRCFEEDSEDDEDFDYVGIGDEEAEDTKEMLEAFSGSQDTTCLACNLVMESPEKIIAHMTAAHQFDLVKICLSYKVDQILFIKLINYVRKNKSEIEVIKSYGFGVASLDDSYMVPTEPDDAFLRFGKSLTM